MVYSVEIYQALNSKGITMISYKNVEIFLGPTSNEMLFTDLCKIFNLKIDELLSCNISNALGTTRATL